MSALNHKHYYNTINFDSDYIKLDTLKIHVLGYKERE